MRVIRNWHLYIVLSAIIFTLLFLFSISPLGYNTVSENAGPVNIQISPVEIPQMGFFTGSQSIKIIMINEVNTSFNFLISYGNQLINGILKPNGSAIYYLSPDTDFKAIHFVFMGKGNTYYFSIELRFISEVPSLISEVIFLSLPFLYYLFLSYYNWKWKYSWIIILAGYILLAPFFGQRYDMYFMLTSPLRILHGINPFYGNSQMPGGLKWAYPPLYLLFGIFFFYVLHLFGINFSPTYTPLVPSGFEYSAWRGFYTPWLPVLYLLEKIPLIISTFIIFILLRDNASIKYEKWGIEKIWLLNPLVILIGTLWGQFDMISLLMTVLSIISFKRGKTGQAIFYSTLGGFIKIFPIILVPYILIKSRNKLRDMLITVAVSLASISIYLFVGNFAKDLEVLIYSRGVPTVNGIFFANGITWQIIPMYLHIQNFPTIFVYILVPFYIILLYFAKTRNLGIVEFNLLFILAFFVFFDFVNPQYFIIPVSMFILLGRKKEAIVFTLIPTVYVFLNYSFPYFVNYYYSYNYFSSILGFGERARLYITDSFQVMTAFVLISTAIYILTLRNLWKASISRNKIPD